MEGQNGSHFEKPKRPHGAKTALFFLLCRFLRVVFGVTSSPFLLNGTVKHHFDRYAKREKAVTDKLKDDFYDLVSGCQTLSVGKELYTKSKSIMHCGVLIDTPLLIDIKLIFNISGRGDKFVGDR